MLPCRAGVFYHVYNRGANRQPIFLAHGNWRFFLARLRHYADHALVEVICYCLMPNHLHLLLRSEEDDLGRRFLQPFMLS